jgi:Ca2+-binding RTX toxin-like protein
MATIKGNSKRNTLKGTSSADKIYGYGGNDTLLGKGGNDKLFGGAGNDRLDSGTGNDSLRGDAGNDTLIGGVGNDTMSGGLGDDTFVVDNALDVVVEAVGGGTDTVESIITHTLAVNVEKLTLIGLGNINGTGNDLANTITGNGGNNTLDGGVGADTLFGGAGDDTFIIDDAGDTVSDTSGTDTVQSSISYMLGAGIENLTLTATSISGTGNGLDNIITAIISGFNALEGLGGADTLIGNGISTLSYANSATGVTVDIKSNTASGGDAQGDIISGFSGIFGSEKDDDLTGTDVFAGLLSGGGGNDKLTGGSDIDRLNGGEGDDTLDGGLGGDDLLGDNGTDTVTYLQSGSGIVASLADNSLNTGMALGDTYSSIEILIGSHLTLSGDTLTGNATASTTIFGMAGNDTLIGGSASDILNGGDDDDTLNGAGGADILDGGSGTNTLNGGTGNDLFLGGSGADACNGDGDTDTVSYAVGAAGGVTVNLATGVGSGDIAAGDTYNQIENIVGTLFADTLTGDANGNLIEGGANGDLIDGGDGADTLDGGTGSNTIDCGNDTFADHVILRVGGVANLSNWDFFDGDKLIIDISETGISSLSAGVNFFSFNAPPPGNNGAGGTPIFYNDSSAGTLYYDADGGTGNAPVLIAQGFTGNLLASDFDFIA